MDIIEVIKELIIHMLYFVTFFIVATILGFTILFLIIWDCLIFIGRTTKGKIWQKIK